MDQYIEMSGGLDLETLPQTVTPGSARALVNMYEGNKGGYTSVKGYEGIDNGVSPTDCTWYVYKCGYVSGPDAIAASFPLFVPQDDSTSFIDSYDGVSSDVLWFGEDGLGQFTFISMNPALVPYDTWPVNRPLVNNNQPANTYTLYIVTERGEPNVSRPWETWDVAGVDATALRTRGRDIRATGGDVAGVHQIAGKVLAWGSDPSGDGVMSVVSGVPSVSKNWPVSQNAHIYLVDTTTSAVDGRVILGTSEAALSTPAGWYLQDVVAKSATEDYLIMIYLDAGIVPATSPTLTTTINAANGDSLGVVTAVPGAWVPLSGGAMKGFTHNFYAGVNTRRVYFADGVNPPMYYDTITDCVVPCLTGYEGAYSISTHVAEFQGRLVSATGGGGFITSVNGEPILADGTLGSIEIGVGDFVTDFGNPSANELVIYTTSSTWSLSGTSPADWKLRLVSGDSGCLPHCGMNMGELLAADDFGIIDVKRSDTLGGFESSTITTNIQGDYVNRDKTSSCSVVMKGLEQFRVFFGTIGYVGTRIQFQTANGNASVRYGLSVLVYPDAVEHIQSCRDTGSDKTVFSSTGGRVFEMDKGADFNGSVILSFLQLAFNTCKTPQSKKRFTGVTWNTYSPTTTSLAQTQSVSDGRTTYDSKILELNAGSAATTLGYSSTRLKGSGHNIQLTLTRAVDNKEPYTITGYTLRYTQRGLVTI